MPLDLTKVLEIAVQKGISDIHLKQWRPPAFRHNGALVRPPGSVPLQKEDIDGFLDQVLTDDRHRMTLSEDGAVDVAYDMAGVARFRINVYRQMTGVALAIRVIPKTIKDIRELGLPPAVERMAEERRGLILVTGATGSGKSTTLAAIMQRINSSRQSHIVTIEDPIEFVLEERNCVIEQREIGTDTKTFAGALRAALRQDPDVIMIGELRDRETIEIALQAAETGHLVLSTMHTIDAVETIERVVSVFDPKDQVHIRELFASVVQWIVSQRLLERKDGKGRVPGVEIVRGIAHVKEMITKRATARELMEVVARGYKTYGMQTFDQCLMGLHVQGHISLEQALQHCSNPADFRLRLSGVTGEGEVNYEDFVPKKG